MSAVAISYYNLSMIPKLTPELSEALHSNGNQPTPVVDPADNQVYFLVTQSTLDKARQTEDEDAIRDGIADMEAGRHYSVDEAKAQLQQRQRDRLAR
ncbi:hypothetical protein Poly51_22560 [Rubripirellula tenax]|uniref:Uncharacterized protein n=2 Tax=Rubripirellula tenax TaxID=2528015 RepID=A0A5C6FDB8_9BACT|nr:hypothetical protein Poly51_22560 [Rubripirellula tenax]